jgi:hypothetical protein
MTPADEATFIAPPWGGRNCPRCRNGFNANAAKAGDCRPMP